jgi:hypothetical protein
MARLCIENARVESNSCGQKYFRPFLSGTAFRFADLAASPGDAAHKHPKVKAWLAANPRIHVHFTPTSGSWLNLVEVWFGIIERQAIHRGAFLSVRDLMIKIRAFINGWNDRCQPFVWTKTADQILTKADRKTTSVAVH